MTRTRRSAIAANCLLSFGIMTGMYILLRAVTGDVSWHDPYVILFALLALAASVSAIAWLDIGKGTKRDRAGRIE